MSAMVEYLVGDPRYGEYGIRNTYEAIWGGADPTAALLNNVNGLVADWWPDFFESYVGGDIYGVGSDVFTRSENLSGSWTIDDDEDTLKVFASSDPGVGLYPDFSAKPFMINLNHTAIDAAANMVLKVSAYVGDEPVTMIVFGIKDGPLEYWGHTAVQSEFFEIEGLRDYIDAGWRQLLVVVVNSDFDPSPPSPYTGTSDITLEVTTEPEGPQYNSFDFMIRVVGYWRHVYGDNTYEYDANLEEVPWQVDNIPGELTEENKFEGSYEFEGASGEVTATLNAARDTVLTVNLEMRSSDLTGRVWYHSFTASDVPILWEDQDWAWFRIEGIEVCNYLDDVQYTYSNPAAEESKTLIGFHCTDEGARPSLLILSFHKEQLSQKAVSDREL